jgi:peptidoglycan/LPS O-acetylase OafA/YrhL
MRYRVRRCAEGRHLKNLPYIDAARGLAILMVILVHTSQSIGGLPDFAAATAQAGQIGVQLFFVASAYTMCSTFSKPQASKHRVASFYLRRLFRIAPLYYFGIAVYCLVQLVSAYCSTHRVDFGPYGLNAVAANVLFVHGFVPWAYNNIVPGGWSIGTEMAFYLLFPFLFMVASRAHARVGGVPLMLLPIVVSINVLVQILLNLYTSYSWSSSYFIYFNLVNQLPAFAAGMLLFFFHESHPASESNISLLWASGFLVCGLVVFLPPFSAALLFIGPPLFFGIAFAFLIDFMRAKRIESGILQVIGKVSYSMYVIHFLFAWYGLRLLTSHLSLEGISALLFLGAAYVAVCWLTFVTARLTERWIERPGIKAGRRIVAFLDAAKPAPVPMESRQ